MIDIKKALKKKQNLSFVISGATCTGKTNFSIHLAQYLKETTGKSVSILNFDSLLFYKELSIGVARPTMKERQDIDHYLLDIASAKEEFNASDYVRHANPIIHDLFKKNHILLFVGGSGFYIRALLKGLYEGEKTDNTLKDSLKKQYEKEGINPFLQILKKYDPLSFKTLHPNDHYRIIRAVEYFLTNKKPISFEKEKMNKLDPYDFENKIKIDSTLIHLNLKLEKSLHLQLIEKRTLNMIKMGLIDEVRDLLNSNFTGEEKPLKSIGYKETISMLRNNKSQNELLQDIIISTRKLAKAQKTFFKRCLTAKAVDPMADFKKTFTHCLSEDFRSQ